MNEERLQLKKKHYLFIAFDSRKGKPTKYYRTDKPVRIETMPDGMRAYRIVNYEYERIFQHVTY